MTLKRAALVYITQSLPHEGQAALIHEFNNPKTPISQQNQIQFHLADVNVLGKPIEDIAALHLGRGATASPEAADDVSESLIVVADEGTSPCSHPQTVLIVKLVDGLNSNVAGITETENRFQTVRVLASNAASVLATIGSGQHGWDDYWNVAEVNGGHFPGE